MISYRENLKMAFRDQVSVIEKGYVVVKRYGPLFYSLATQGKRGLVTWAFAESKVEPSHAQMKGQIQAVAKDVNEVKEQILELRAEQASGFEEVNAQLNALTIAMDSAAMRVTEAIEHAFEYTCEATVEY